MATKTPKITEKEMLNNIEQLNNIAESLKKIIAKYKPKPVTERIKNLDDILAEVNLDNDEKALWNYVGTSPRMIAARAELIIGCLAEVLNEGWVPDYEDLEQVKYYPLWKYQDGSFFYTGTANGTNRTCISTRFAFRSKALVEYAATNFSFIYVQTLVKF